MASHILKRCALLLPLFLAGCLNDPAISARSEPEFVSSYEKATANLDRSQRSVLDVALKDIVLIEADAYAPLLEARMEAETDKPSPLVTAVLGSAKSAIRNAIDAEWERNRAGLIVRHAATLIDGKTVAEIITIAEGARRKVLQQTLDVYREQLSRAERELAELEATGQEQEAKRAEHDAILSEIVLTKARFYYSKDRYSADPVVAFTIANNGSFPVKRIFVRGKVQTPGRAIPWVEEQFNYQFPGGLEPGESQNLSLAPNRFSEWGKVPQDAVKGATLTLTLLAVEDASENRIGEGSESEDLEARRRAIIQGITRLQQRIQELEAQIGSGA